MNGAEFRTVREGLGLSMTWLAHRWGHTSEQSITQWEAQDSAMVPHQCAADLSFLEGLASSRTQTIVNEFLVRLDAVGLDAASLDPLNLDAWPRVVVPLTDQDCEKSGLPASFFRACVYRAKYALNGKLMITYRELE